MMRALPFANLLPFAVLAIVASCSPDEPIIDNTVRSWRLLLVHANGSVADVSMPAGVSTSPTTLSSEGGVEICRQYRDDIYAVMRDSSRIIVLDARTMAERQRIELETEGPATDIVFANATTAYALHATTNAVSVIDLTVGRVVQRISVANRPVAAAVLGNQIGVVCQGAERLDIVDSRTNTVEASIPIPDAPTFIDIDLVQDAFCVATLGAGRIDSRPATTPKLHVVRVRDRSVLGTVDLTNREPDGPRQRIGGLTIVPEQFAFVPVTTGMLRINPRTRARATTIGIDEYHSIAYNAARNEILLLEADSLSVRVFDEFVDKERSSFRSTLPVRQMLALPPR